MEAFIHSSEFISVLEIIIIDIVLGGDNAIVIALACKNLPEKQRKLGIFYGAIGAIILRVIMVFFAAVLLMQPYLKIVGGIMLIWIGIKLCLDNKKHITNVKQEFKLFDAVKTIIIVDLVMSLDNSIAIAAAAKGNIYIVIFGLLLSIPIIIWGSKIILKLIDKFPYVIYFGAVLIGWIGGEMIQTDAYTTTFGTYGWFPIAGGAIVFTYSMMHKRLFRK